MAQDIPQHISFILDGNRRWAKRQGLPTLEGHMAGMRNCEKIAEWCMEAGVKYLTMYAFSTENWSRSAEEKDYLFNKVIISAFRDYFDQLLDEGVKVNIFGELSQFPEGVRSIATETVEKSKNNDRLVVNICLDYGGRSELVRAAQRIVESGVVADDITEQTLSDNLYSAGIPDPDLMIRTGGEHRLSNFLLWQHAYSELYFPEVELPGFTKEDFDKALEWYATRDRRYGK